MNPNIKKILEELYEINPDFKKYSKELEKIIQEIIDAKPEAIMDENFKKNLHIILKNKMKDLFICHPDPESIRERDLLL